MTGGRAALAAAFALVALPAVLAAQTQRQDIWHQIRQVEAEIAELETIERQITSEGYLAIVSSAGGALVPRDAAADFFVLLLLEGELSPEAALEYVSRLRLATRIYLREHILPDLEAARGLRAELYRRLQATVTGPPIAAPQPQPPAVPDGPWEAVRVKLTGTYTIQCGGRNLNGTAEVTLTGDGKATGKFIDVDRVWIVPGEFYRDGSVDGLGVFIGTVEQGGDRFDWRVELRRRSGSVHNERGLAWFYPGGQNTCLMGSVLLNPGR